MTRILIFNPSNYSRGGYVSLPWQEIHEATGYEPEEIILYQHPDSPNNPGNPLFFQVDQIDPADPSLDTLSFFLARPIDPRPENYLTPSSVVYLTSTGVKPKTKRPRTVPKQVQTVELSNGQFVMRLNLSPESEDRVGFWYAGCATSVRFANLNWKEFLDYNRDLLFQGIQLDAEKRCAQLDSILLSHPRPQPEPYLKVNLFNQPYRLVSESDWHVRKCVTIASTPFYYNYWTRGDLQPTPLKCELYRVFSLFKGRDYVVEDLFINAKPVGKRKATSPIELYFTARYFTYMDMGAVVISRSDDVPDWFAIANIDPPYYGYGFATDAHTRLLQNPHPQYADIEDKKKTFSWELDHCRGAKCLHQFFRYEYGPYEPRPDQTVRQYLQEKSGNAKRWFEYQAGHSWYDLLYAPIYARLSAGGTDV